MTGREPQPVGNEQTAWTRLLKRAHKAENRNRELRQQITNLTAQIDAQEDHA